jgi:hypothetical protein
MQLPVPSIDTCWLSGRQANKPHAAEGATVTGEPSGLVTDRPIRFGGAVIIAPTRTGVRSCRDTSAHHWHWTQGTSVDPPSGGPTCRAR